jgi:hypothetical protein
MKMVIGFVSAIILSFILPGAADAHDDGHKGCGDDVKKYCSDVKPGGGRIMECLKAHEDKLSSWCMEEMHEKKAMMKEAKEAHKTCKEDLEKFCADVKPGQGRKMECLKSHREELSPHCKDEMKEMHDKKHKDKDK